MNSQSTPEKQQPAGAQTLLQRVLLEALGEARIRNPAYSLRAFARRIRISPAALSEILNNKRDVSAKLATKILSHLAVDPLTNERVLNAFPSKKSTTASSSKSNKTSNKQEQKYTVLSADHFRAIADWYHFAILSLFETTSCPQTPAQIGARLGVRSSDVAVALERLERLGMLLRSKNGRYRLTGEPFHSSDGVISSAVKASHAQALQLAQKSLEQDPIELRDFTSLTMAINPDKLAKAKKMIREFRTNLARELEVDPKQEVYMLCVQLFPVSGHRDDDSHNTVTD